MNFDKFEDEHCCNNFCSYYGLQPFSPETHTRLEDAPTSEGSSFVKNKAWKGKGRAEPEVDVDYVNSSWNGGVAKDFVNIEPKRKDYEGAGTSTAGGFTKRMDLSS